MKRIFIIAGVLLIVISILFLLGFRNNNPEPIVIPTPASETTTEVSQGNLIGFVEANGAHVWRGVPFGADTSGKNR